jgi:hypothetical protein
MNRFKSVTKSSPTPLSVLWGMGGKGLSSFFSTRLIVVSFKKNRGSVAFSRVDKKCYDGVNATEAPFKVSC